MRFGTVFNCSPLRSRCTSCGVDSLCDEQSGLCRECHREHTLVGRLEDAEPRLCAIDEMMADRFRTVTP
jgi:hypothetical protein